MSTLQRSSAAFYHCFPFVSRCGNRDESGWVKYMLACVCVCLPSLSNSVKPETGESDILNCWWLEARPPSVTSAQPQTSSE